MITLICGAAMTAFQTDGRVVTPFSVRLFVPLK